MTPQTKNLLKTLFGVGGTALVFTVACALVGQWVLEDKGKQFYPDAAPVHSDDTIIPDYIRAVHQQSAECDKLVETAHALEETAEHCMETLRECTSMLESNHLIPKAEREEK